MADLTPAQELRAAAKLMRERAEAAKELTGDGHGDWFPWGIVQQTEWQDFPEPRPVPVPFSDGETELAPGDYVPTGEAFVAHARWAHDQEESWHEAEFFAGPMPEGLAAFIASMHPGFAEAVADWLDAEAERVEKLGVGAPLLYSLGPGPLAVARAFLGSEENDDA